jgi:adenine-specific DNA-methyltransferase
VDYKELTREQAINLLVKRDAQRKLGLVWEREEIDPDAALNSDFVVMDLDANGGSCGNAPYHNLIIEGDNFDALRWLRMTNAGQVKVIYIDPPYNTGNKDWVYNDNYRRADDRYPHSTWLDWLYRRLSIARDLLRPDGVILVSINDENRAKLELLMDEVFPGMRIGSFVWKRRMGTGDEAGSNFSIDHEHVLAYAGPAFRFAGGQRDNSKYKKSADAECPWADITLTQNKTYKDRPNSYFPILNPETDVWYPCNPNRAWACVREATGGSRTGMTLERLLAERRILFKQPDNYQIFDARDELIAAIRDGSAHPYLRENLPDLDFWVGRKIGLGSVRLKKFLDDLDAAGKPLSSWIAELGKKDSEDDEVEVLASALNAEGTSTLQEILDDRAFNYPKPPSLIEGLIGQCSTGDDVVLDFFAGSGTTAHAVMRLNAADGERRRFILVSSTETTPDAKTRNICKEVCAKRVRRVIEGYDRRTNKGKVRVLGLPGNFAYLIAERVDFRDLSYAMTPERIWVALQVMHGLPISPVERNKPVQLAVGEDDILIAYCDRFTEASEETLKKFTAERLTIVYAYTPGPVRDAFVGNNRVEVRAVTDEFLRRFRA